MGDFLFCRLPGRGAVTVSGSDRRHFLNALISNDINRLDAGGLVYACLLTAQGKFLHDFFAREMDGAIILDCEGGARAADLHRRLAMYKLRADVQIGLDETADVIGLWRAADDTAPPPAGFFADPRHAALGYRGYGVLPQGDETDFDVWDARRIRHAVPDGSRDMIPGTSNLMESGIDTLNGIDFDKGCYIGQELTARMHYRALVKKRLRPIKISAVAPDDLAQMDLRSRCGDDAIALVRD